MTKKEKLLEKAKNNPKNLRYKEFIILLKQNGWNLRKSSGSSHQIFTNPDYNEFINIQNDNGYAVDYQIEDFLRIMDK